MMAGIFPKAFQKRMRRRGKVRRYDLPLVKDLGNRFLIFLCALLTFLLLLTLGFYHVTQALSTSWTSDLAQTITIEIPYEDGAQSPAATAKILEESLKQIAGVTTVDTLSQEEILSLIGPWQGNESGENTHGFFNKNLPALLSVSVENKADNFLNALEQRVKEVAPRANLDTHQDWLATILSFTGYIALIALLVILFITLGIVTTIAGAVQARMMIYRQDLELLHLMGASDGYITRQFMRFMAIQIAKGTIAGALLLLVFFAMATFLTRGNEALILPSITWEPVHLIVLLAVPALLCLLGVGTTAVTVLRFLRKMP